MQEWLQFIRLNNIDDVLKQINDELLSQEMNIQYAHNLSEYNYLAVHVYTYKVQNEC